MNQPAAEINSGHVIDDVNSSASSEKVNVDLTIVSDLMQTLFESYLGQRLSQQNAAKTSPEQTPENISASPSSEKVKGNFTKLGDLMQTLFGGDLGQEVSKIIDCFKSAHKYTSPTLDDEIIRLRKILVSGDDSVLEQYLTLRREAFEENLECEISVIKRLQKEYRLVNDRS